MLGGGRGVLTIQLGHEGLELLRGDPLGVADLVYVGVEGDVGSDKEDVVDLVLAPDSVAVWCKIVDPGEVLELVERHLLGSNAQLVVKLALRSTTDTNLLGLLELSLDRERV